MGQTTPLGFLDSSAFWIACVIKWPPFHDLPPDHSPCLLIYLQSPIYLHRLIWRYSLVSRIIHGFLPSLFYLWVPCPLLYVNSSFIGVDAGSSGVWSIEFVHQLHKSLCKFLLLPPMSKSRNVFVFYLLLFHYWASKAIVSKHCFG